MTPVPAPAHPDDRQARYKDAGRLVAQILLETGAVNFRPEEPYTLTAGWASPVYIDCRRLISFPRARRRIIALATDQLQRDAGFEAFDAVAGGETAGIPYGAWLADAFDLPMLYVRKKPKGFGRMAQIEGTFPEGARVLLVEDLATDGGSKLAFCTALREAGAQVSHAFVVFFYGVFPGALKTLEEADVSLHFLCTWWDVLEEAEARRAFPEAAIQGVRDFLHDPIGWSARHGGRSE
ncbi:orotate phosphoribosyltransferase [Roseospira navarrensis]|uniref:Orotate phosphoribosyltransferase n=1 Tax=Roseospira navarrensis TaxID=140058 RepID=A0A7X1ZAF8_9PROT|nr:orotate phosphoribosyltransferase [Roseospira navarrensis]MQX34933.1 orotate phosphoribosyltransferase [Roseospira navarrensis]